jgi:prevent-host-death family protein
MRQVTLDQATTHLTELIEAAMGGETIVIVKDNQPAVQLVPVPPIRRQPKFGSAKGLIEVADDFDAPLDDFAEYMK